jgi:hypothetical protein
LRVIWKKSKLKAKKALITIAMITINLIEYLYFPGIPRYEAKMS